MSKKILLVLAGLFLGVGLFTATSHASAAESAISEKDLNDLQGALTQLQVTLNMLSDKLKGGTLKIENQTAVSQILAETSTDLFAVNTTLFAWSEEINKNVASNPSEDAPVVTAEKSNKLLAIVNSDLVSWLWVLVPFVVILGVIAFLRRRVSVGPKTA